MSANINFFDTTNNYVSKEQVRQNIKAKMNSIEYKNAMKELVHDMKLKQPDKFKNYLFKENSSQ
jgi:hypothetical protein